MVEFTPDQAQALEANGFRPRNGWSFTSGIWDCYVYSLGRTALYGLRYNNQRVFGPTGKFDDVLSYYLYVGEHGGARFAMKTHREKGPLA